MLLFASFWEKLGDAIVLSLPVVMSLVGMYLALRREQLRADTAQNAKLDDIHLLVNSQMGVQKQLLAATARAKAVITNEEGDIAAADKAEAELAEHNRAQATFDAATK